MAGIEGSAGEWSMEPGRGQTVEGPFQHASQFDPFPEDDGVSLTQESDKVVLSFKGISQAAMSRLERMERKPENLGWISLR